MKNSFIRIIGITRDKIKNLDDKPGEQYLSQHLIKNSDFQGKDMSV